MSRKHISSSIAAALVLTSPLAAQEAPSWNVTLGASLGHGPKFVGSEESEAKPGPIVLVDYKGIVGIGGSRSVDGLGLFVRPYQNDVVGFGLLAVRTDKRKERNARILAGMGTRAARTFVGAELTFAIGTCEAALEIMKGTEARSGLVSTLQLSRTFPLSEAVGLSLEAQQIWADRDYQAWEFGITPKQAAERRRLIDAGNTYLRAREVAAYAPGSGLREYRLGASLQWQMTEHWTSSASLQYGRLIGKAADSPLVRKADQVSSGLSLAYRF